MSDFMYSQDDFRFLGNLPDIAGQEFVERAKQADAEAVDRILAAVGKDYVPTGLDRRALSVDIAGASHRRHHGSNLLGGSEAQDRVKLLRRIGKTTEKLISLLDKNPAVKAILDGRLAALTPPPMSPFQTVIQPIPKPTDQLNQWLHKVADIQESHERTAHKWRTPHKHDPALKGRRVSEREYLAGVHHWCLNGTSSSARDGG